MTTPLIGTPVHLKAPYPIASAYFPDGILPEHTLVFAGEGRGDWEGLWTVIVVGRFHWPHNPFNFIDSPAFHIEPSAFL